MKAVSFANQRKLPIVIDPVGSGASEFRTNTVKALLEEGHHTILKGNASEIISLTKKTSSKGVDSLAETFEALDSARELLRNNNLKVVAITGKDDYVLNADSTFKHSNGSEMMTKVTGMGCVLTAIVTSFCAVNADQLLAVRNAITYTGIAGEKAFPECSGPGSFQTIFLDKLHGLKFDDIKTHFKTQVC